ncbi:MAG: hypothetical protein V1690_02935 [Candidatus Moraniibacteriota bacterium]
MLKKQKVVFFLAVGLVSLIFLLGSGEKTEAWIEDCHWICDGELLWCGGTICVTSEKDRAYYGYTAHGLCRPGEGGCRPEDLGGHYGWLCRNSCTGAGWCDNVPPPPLGYRCHYISYWYCSGSTPVPVWDSVMNSGCSDAGPPYCPPPCTPNCGDTSQRCTTDTWDDGCGNNTCRGTKDCSIDLTLSASSNLVEYDNPANLIWTPRNATGCWGEPWPVIGGKSSANGTYIESTGNLTSSKTYSMRCWNPYNSVTKDVSVCVKPKCDNPGNSCSAPANRCLSGTSTAVTESPLPTSPSSSVGSFNWKCQDTCNGVLREVSCSSEKSNPLVAEGSPSESIWSDCNLSCGGGSETRTISYHNCYKKTETQACNSQPCPPGYREVTPW